MSGSLIHAKALGIIRDFGTNYKMATPYTELVTELSDFATEDEVIESLEKMQKQGHIVITKSESGDPEVRGAETNSDGTAQRCRYCNEARESHEAWDAASNCSHRAPRKPCVPRWVPYRGRDKLLPLDPYEVNRVLRTIQDAREAVAGRSVWAPLAITPNLCAPISQTALVALMRHCRDNSRCLGVHASDQPLTLDTAEGFVVVIDVVESDSPDKSAR
ncbi:MAG: hypothetical protein F4121_03020 [Acidimicrobiia bacterium]|nr:hypothetical protein [Acidimicrobiia bacterium]MYC46370.1 hypothetical protein [Acidimicrobiia bacterium]MYI19076.1 hypothetical protein [Acidimicrobiia bacterium]